MGSRYFEIWVKIQENGTGSGRPMEGTLVGLKLVGRNFHAVQANQLIIRHTSTVRTMKILIPAVLQVHDTHEDI